MAILMGSFLHSLMHLSLVTPPSPPCFSSVPQKTMERGVNKFNVNPKDGIAYLIENGLVADTAESICNFLSTGEGLSKRRIGEYFGRVRIREATIRR